MRYLSIYLTHTHTALRLPATERSSDLTDIHQIFACT